MDYTVNMMDYYTITKEILTVYASSFTR